MKIMILGPGCSKCNKVEKMVKKVVSETRADATIEKVTDMMQIAGYGVMSTPAVVIDGEVKCVGKIPDKDEIKAWLNS